LAERAQTSGLSAPNGDAQAASPAPPAAGSAPPPAPAAAAVPPAAPPGEVVKLAPAKIEPFLARCELFKGADKSIVARAATLLAGVEVPAGAAVVTAGAPSDGLGIVFSGKVSVRLPDGSDRFVVDERMLTAWTAHAGARLADPIKTTNVQGQRCMTTWSVFKPDGRSD